MSRKDSTSLVSLAIFIIALFLIPKNGIADDIQLVERITFDKDVRFYSTPKSLSVTEDGLLVLPGKSTVKVFSKNNKGYLLVAELSQQLGNSKLIRPKYLSYNCDPCNQYGGRLAVIDFGAKKIFTFKRTGKTTFIPEKEINCPFLGYDIGFWENQSNRLFVSGYTTDKEDKPFDLYSIDLEKLETKFMLNSHNKYGLSNYKEYHQKYYVDQTLPAMGVKAYTDLTGSNLYYAWEASFRILKLRLDNGEILTSFGKQPVSLSRKDLKQNVSDIQTFYKIGDFVAHDSAKKKIPRIVNLFSTEDHVFVIYKTTDSTIRMQKYNSDGDYLEDISLSPTLTNAMWFDKENYELYAISRSFDKETFSVLKYKIRR